MKAFILWKILPLVISLSAFSAIIYFSPPPPDWHQAPILQIIAVLLTLLFSLLFLFNLFLPKFRYNSILSLTILVLIFLHALGELDLITTSIIVVAALALILVLTDFKLLKLPKSKEAVREPVNLPSRSDRVKRLRRLSYLTTRKK